MISTVHQPGIKKRKRQRNTEVRPEIDKKYKENEILRNGCRIEEETKQGRKRKVKDEITVYKRTQRVQEE